ncbi:Invasion protein IalB, involved in pathogenesis [Faunimonas pinastri]|uniref:Invasion protein IalB, involved in pathogenesis n=1 Tax=Faunimonas pinastri TaxID=1855383 RepID=A0A1H9L9S1_9HYPH|nr:invasion associated locus B family protein [Faunimonas pinastri]SER07885.1 Invasion protein IalB, involved in pathogenesis [Faunimonas pinastri]
MLWTRKSCAPIELSAKAGLVAAALLAFGAAPALAENAKQAAPAAGAQNEGPQPDWVKLCSQNPQNKQQICVTTRERRAATGQLLAALSIREVDTKKYLVTAVPPGMLLRPGLQVQIDGSKPTKAQYTICFPNLCFAEAEINADYVNNMKKGNQLIITTLTQEAKPINFNISLSGFKGSYEGPAMDPAKLQAQNKKLQDDLQAKAEAARKALIDKQQQQK